MRICLTIAAVLALAAPAHAAKPAPPSDTALHAYVVGRYAALDNEVGLAARLMETARAADPGAATVTRRAWELAATNGDQARAFQLARSLAAMGVTDPEVTMMRIADAVIRKDWALAANLRQSLDGQGWPMVAGPIIDAWVAAGRGDSATALSLLDPQRQQGVLRNYVLEQRAHLLASLRRWDEAATAYRQARSAGGAAQTFMRRAQADALAMAGRRDDALAVLFPGDPALAVPRARLLAGERVGPMATDARAGIAWLAGRLAADLARERAEFQALLFARLATFLAPEQPLTWLVMADMLLADRQYDQALAAYDRIPASAGLDSIVRVRRAEVLVFAGKGEAAGAILQQAVAAPDATADDWATLASWHRRYGRHAEAAAAYGTAIDRFGAGMGASAWNLHYLRALMRDNAGDWPGAEADLRRALALSPNEPTVMNYLGYTLLENGAQGAEARALIEKAAQLRPGDGGIIDSLGWAQLKAGEVDKAVATLERAVSLEPQAATIISHLGDALWQQGRRIEARFRWRQALAVVSGEELKRGLQARLDYGLDAAPAMLAQK